MTEAEIAAQVARFRALHLHKPDDRHELLVAQKGDTLITLGLERSLLRTYQVSWTSGFTRQSYALQRDLCSGEYFVIVHVIGDPHQAGARVWMDGELVGELANSGIISLEVPLGRHLLRVEEPGGGSWSAELEYDESSCGYARVPIDLRAGGAPGGS